MKHLALIIVLFTIACNNFNKGADEDGKDATPVTIPNSKYYTLKDTLVIVTEIGDTLRFAKNEFNSIIDNHPEFFDVFVASPDILYNCYVKNNDFGSEQGRDLYYALYAYFLKQNNGVKEFADQRRRLVDIYSRINSLFAEFQHGGTFFGHQRLRILGYVEYSLSTYPKRFGFEKTYDIGNQKELYIKSLRQLISDESSIDLESLGAERNQRNKDLNKIVDEIDTLITDIFYLRNAQEFQYSNYVYY